jgi:cell division protease FtsH
MSGDGNYSEQTAREIDQEVKQLIQNQEGRVKELLATLKPALLTGAKRLLDQEVMMGTELQALLKEQKGEAVSSPT